MVKVSIQTNYFPCKDIKITQAEAKSFAIGATRASEIKAGPHQLCNSLDTPYLGPVVSQFYLRMVVSLVAFEKSTKITKLVKLSKQKYPYQGTNLLGSEGAIVDKIKLSKPLKARSA